MNIRDLYSLNDKVLRIIEVHNPTSQYNELVAHLSTMRSSPTPELQATVNEDVAAIESHNDLIDEKLNITPHIKFLETTTDIREVVGAGATSRLKDILSNDPYFATASIQEEAIRISNFVAFLQDTNKALASYGVETTESEEPALISFELEGEADTNTTSELKYRLEQIEKIIHAFSRLEGEPGAFSKPEIYSISKSSPIIIDLGTSVESLTNPITPIMLTKGITWAMDRIEQAQRIMLNYEKLKKEGMSNEEIDSGFKTLEAEVLSKESIQKFVDEGLLTDKMVKLVDEAGTSEEKRKALAIAMKNLVTLIQKGASANVYLPKNVTAADAETQESIEEANEYTQKVAQLQKTIAVQNEKIKLISAGNEPTGLVSDDT